MPLTIDDVVKIIRTKKVIPILGYELLYNSFNEEVENLNIDFLKSLIIKHIQRMDQQGVPDFLHQGISGQELVNKYYQSLSLNNKETFKQDLKETMDLDLDRSIEIPESIRKIACIKHFNLFINATISPKLQIAINAYRDNCSAFHYHTMHLQDLPQKAPDKPFIVKFDNPTVYNLFSIPDYTDDPDFVITDADYIELIYDFMSYNRNRIDNLKSYLKNGYLLFLGCNFPDWFFRFFIRICVDDRLHFMNPIERKVVIDSLNQIDSSRSFFINQFGINTIQAPANTNELINEIYQRFLEVQGTPDLNCDVKNNRVFISYCNPDSDFVLNKIVSAFKKKHIEYFLDKRDLNDNENEKGTYSLRDNIQTEIDRCCLFLPIVSKNVFASTKSVWLEWNRVVKTKKKIKPVFKDFVDPDSYTNSNIQVEPDVRDKILDPTNTYGIRPDKDNNISDDDLETIAKIQYKSRI